MNTTQKKGRMPISQKSTENSDFAGPTDTSLLRLAPEQRRELDGKGLAFRWISLKEFQANGNFHKNGYVPYKFESLKKPAEEFAFGSHPEGYLIRKELVLAVVPKEEHAAHKARIRQRTQAQSQVVKTAASQMRQALKGSGAKVYEGYEENGGDDSDDE